MDTYLTYLSMGLTTFIDKHLKENFIISIRIAVSSVKQLIHFKVQKCILFPSRLLDMPMVGIHAEIKLPLKALCGVLGHFEIRTFYAIKRESKHNLTISRK